MKKTRSRVIALAAVPVLCAVALSAAPAGSASQVSAGASAPDVRPGVPAVLRLGHAGTPSVVQAPSGRSPAEPRAMFTVTYTGFTPAAKNAFQRAVNLWAPVVSSTVPITVDASFAPLGTNVLGSAGPNNVWRDFTGAPQPETWYPDALANKLAGTQLDPGADINAQFSSSFSDWWFGIGPAPADRIDFTSVVMHELGHGLGFLGAGAVNSGEGSVRLGTSPRLPLIYDEFTENRADQALLTFGDQTTLLANQLTGNQVFFDSPAVVAAIGGRARLYAPITWQQGSSYSHLNEGTYAQGNLNSLMTPMINYAETIRVPGPITRAVFSTIGW